MIELCWQSSSNQTNKLITTTLCSLTEIEGGSARSTRLQTPAAAFTSLLISDNDSRVTGLSDVSLLKQSG
jgi:hypothetical protein